MNTYNPDFFIPWNLQDAKNIILTKEDIGTEIRWQKENEWVIKLFDTLIEIDDNSIVLDWGCGIGRISKLLIDRYNCQVIGVDLQPKMLEYAKEYVNSDRFNTIHYQNSFLALPSNTFTHVTATWVFQHSPYLQFEIPLIYRSMKYDATLFVLENMTKVIPAPFSQDPNDQKFYDDGIQTKSLLDQIFETQAHGRIPVKYSSEKMNQNSWWAIMKKHQILGE